MRRSWLLLVLLLMFFGGHVSSVHAGGWISGPTAGLNPRLKANLYRLHKAFGRPVRITPGGGCRLRGNRRAPKSWHRRAVGCKAADVVIPGVSRRAILAWWARHVGGGRGYYCGRSFVHVDVGPSRSWSWYCKKRRVRYAHARRR